MATMKLIENGIKSKANGKRKRRRRNPTTTTTAKASNGVKAKRRSNGVTKAGAASFAKKNGLKLVSKTVANGKRKKRRRNGIAKASYSRSNGLFGTGTAIVKKTLTLTGGAVVTNIGGNWLASLVSGYASQFGLGQYTNLITQALVAQFGVPYVARMLKQDGEMAKLGGFLSVTLTALNQFFPQFQSLNPFSQSAIVVNPNGQVALTGGAAAALVDAAQQDTKAKVSGFLNQMSSGAGSGWVEPNYLSRGNVNAIM